jgi:hypothetical protein
MRSYDEKQMTEAYPSPMEVDALIVDFSLHDYELLNLGCEAFIGAVSRPGELSSTWPCFPC